jgi:ABC-2 type transport system permease protein
LSSLPAEAEVSAAPAEAELREVSGPSSLGGGWRRFFSLLWLMAVTEFKRIYFGTVLGYVWSLVRPLTQFAVLLFVFTQIFRIGSDVPNYPVLLLLGIVLFSFFQEGSNNAVTAVVSQEAVVRKTQFPRLVIPLSVVLTGSFNLLVNLVVVFVFILAWGVDPTWTWLLFPLALLLLFAYTAGIAMLLSALYVRFRDVAIIWSVLATVLFYGTPILYPIEIVPDEYKSLIMINPLAPIFEQVRFWVLDPTAPTAVEAAGSWLALLPAIGIFIAVCALGTWVFAREAPRIAEEL